VSPKRVVHVRVDARWMADSHQGKEALCIVLEAAMFSLRQKNTLEVISAKTIGIESGYTIEARIWKSRA